MKEPRRLMSSGADAFERSLLESARGDGGGSAAHQRTLTALGVGVSVPLTAASVGHAAAGASALGKVGATAATKVGGALVAKWVTFGATVGLASMGGLHLITTSPAPAPDGMASRQAVSTAASPFRPPRAPAPALSPPHAEPSQDLPSPVVNPPAGNPSPRRVGEEPAPRQDVAQTAAEVAPSPEPTHESAPAAPAHEAFARPAAPARVRPTSAAPRSTTDRARRPNVRGASALEQEVLALDGVRQALGARNAPQALLMLGLYRGRFPNGALTPEATVLEVQALLLAGERQRATALAETVLADAPHGQHAKIVRSLIAQRPKP